MPETDPAAPASPPGTPAPSPARSRIPMLVLIALLLAGGLAALAWYDTRSRTGATQEELARRLRPRPGAGAGACALLRGNLAAARDPLRLAREAGREREGQRRAPGPDRGCRAGAGQEAWNEIPQPMVAGRSAQPGRRSCRAR